MKFKEFDDNTWTTREGVTIAIKEMTDSHLINTIKYIRRNTPKAMHLEALSMLAYASDAPEGAAYYAELGAMELLENDDIELYLENHGKYQRLLKEARRRKIKRCNYEI